MAQWVDVGGVDDLADGTMKLVEAGGNDLVLAKVEGRFYAADDRCPHMWSRMSMGRLEGTVIECHEHRSRFDLTDGHVLEWTNWTGLLLKVANLLRAPRPLRVFRVEVKDGRVRVEVE